MKHRCIVLYPMFTHYSVLSEIFNFHELFTSKTNEIENQSRILDNITKSIAERLNVADIHIHLLETGLVVCWKYSEYVTEKDHLQDRYRKHCRPILYAAAVFFLSLA